MDRSGPASRPEHHSPAVSSEADVALLAELRGGDPRALDHAVTRYGRRLAGVAYVVLQNRDETQVVVARAFADVWAGLADALPDRPAELEARLLGATARRARESHDGAHEVDAFAAATPVLTRLSPEARAASALHLLGDLTLPRVAAELGIGASRARALLAESTAAMGSAAALRDALARQLEGLPVKVTGEAVRDALANPVTRRRHRRILPIGLGLLALAVLAVGLWAPRAEEGGQPSLARAAGSGADAVAGAPSPTVQPTPQPMLVALADASLSQDECGIQPAGNPLAYSGWLTLEQLGTSPDGLAPTQPVFAIVTDGMAEWIGWRSTSRAMYPRIVGRLACYVDPRSGTLRVIAVNSAWEAPQLAGACPATSVSEVAGYREIGGPGAFVLLPGIGTSWWADDPSVRILARLAPGPLAGEEVTAWAQPLGPGPRVELTVETRPHPAGKPRSMTDYVWLSGPGFDTPGCWVVTIEIKGAVAGSALLPITGRLTADAGG